MPREREDEILKEAPRVDPDIVLLASAGGRANRPFSGLRLATIILEGRRVILDCNCWFCMTNEESQHLVRYER